MNNGYYRYEPDVIIYNIDTVAFQGICILNVHNVQSAAIYRCSSSRSSTEVQKN